MGERKEELLAMENRILLEKQKLNAYILKWELDDDLLLQEKVKDMQKSLDSLQREFLLFKGLVEGKEALEGVKSLKNQEMEEPVCLNAWQPGMQIQNRSSEERIEQSPEKNGKGQEPEAVSGRDDALRMSKLEAEKKGEQEKASPSGIQEASSKKQLQDLEKTIGKSLMGVIASGFIFISIIMFAIVMLPSMSDEFKIAAMFLGSAAFTIVGMLNLKREDYRAFFLTLAGCGIGAFYVSLLVTRFYFQAIGVLPFLVLVLVWTVPVCIFGRKKSRVFQWIGQCGNLISVIFCSNYTSSEGEYSLFFLLLGFYIGASMLYTLLYFEKTFVKNILNFVFNLAGAIVFLIGLSDLCPGAQEGMEAGYHSAAAFCGQLVSILLILYMIAQIVLMYRTRSGENVLGFSILQIFEVGVLILAAGWLGDAFAFNEKWIFLICFVILLCALAAYEWRCRKERQGLRCFYETVSVIAMNWALHNTEALEFHISIMPIVLGLLVAAYLLKNRLFLYLSLGELFFFRFVTLFEDDFSRMERMGWTMFYIVLCLLLHHFIGNADRARIDMGLEEKKRKRTPEYLMAYSEEIHRLLVYAAFFFLFSADIKHVIDALAPDMNSSSQGSLWNFLTCILLGSVNFLVSCYFQKKEYAQMPDIKRFGAVVCTCFQGLCMIFTLCIIQTMEQKVLHILLILFALALFSINTKNLIQKYPGMLCGAYIGLKFTVLVYVILSSFDASNAVISVGCFLFAILCIVAGFCFHYKPLRIYGLVLSLVSTVKLILVDLAYGSAGELALGFFICGILCFGISMIYHGIDKKYKE